MSWEICRHLECICPCGKGKITQAIRGDDWNRFEETHPTIQCTKCAKIYKIESVYNSGRKPGGSHAYTNYFCIPKSYPKFEYNGPVYDSGYIHSRKNKELMDKSFLVKLIESYPKELLIHIHEDLINYRNKKYIMKQGYDKVVELHKDYYNTVKKLVVAEKVLQAINAYDTYEYPFDLLEKGRKEYKRQKNAYSEEKEKHLIKIQLV